MISTAPTCHKCGRRPVASGYTLDRSGEHGAAPQGFTQEIVDYRHWCEHSFGITWEALPMIYEFRTYTLHPRTLTEFLKRWTDALEPRLKLSPLAAFWYTEIGPLNQVIHVWPYENTLERSKIRADAIKRDIWPPKTSEFIAEMKSEIFEPLPYSPPLAPSNQGPYFEMRTYVLKPGGLPGMAQRWGEYLPGRVKLSPLTGVFTSDIGGLNQWVHIWGYKSLDERVAVRKKATADGLWPPPGDSPVLKQETKILLAAPFSPIK